MTIREGMHSLVQEIMDSHEARAAGIGSLQQEVSAQKHETQDWLKEVDKACKAMSQQQRADLAHEETQRKDTVNDWMKEVDKAHSAMAQQQRADLARGRSDLAHEETQRKDTVNDWMKETATDHSEARAAWQNMATTLHTKKGAATKASKTRGYTKRIAEQLSSLANRILEYLTNHPDGSRLAQIEGEFGLKRFEAAGIVKHLQSERKVEKRDLLYFAV